ncbi:hypothetical protein [Paenibacillus mucilaginosus]|uniref:Uncharacterized protein n=1 Tax=Paenibacillus mucilaginosus (strain KNP414) TaxID=1036673 RepID=F8FM43_PAEMK|nr:hypothetical protein [Paenibacillus mucilaginosus]AEI45669.1 hypothetical protein KNP414_07159 [Paenibacillus mucilaginosus KNP414]MCG7215137.1 hypothetical protein [Paenibacillus mucilaginosus]
MPDSLLLLLPGSRSCAAASVQNLQMPGLSGLASAYDADSSSVGAAGRPDSGKR